MFVFCLIWIASAVIGAQLGKPKGKLMLGAVLGLFLGPIGCLVIVLWRKRCPQCASLVKWQANVCKHCHAPQTSRAEGPPSLAPEHADPVDKLYRKISGEPEPVDPNDPVEKWKREHPSKV